MSASTPRGQQQNMLRKRNARDIADNILKTLSIILSVV